MLGYFFPCLKNEGEDYKKKICKTRKESSIINPKGVLNTHVWWSDINATYSCQTHKLLFEQLSLLSLSLLNKKFFWNCRFYESWKIEKKCNTIRLRSFTKWDVPPKVSSVSSNSYGRLHVVLHVTPRNVSYLLPEDLLYQRPQDVGIWDPENVPM